MAQGENVELRLQISCENSNYIADVAKRLSRQPFGGIL
jgi:hypothetical protein